MKTAYQIAKEAIENSARVIDKKALSHEISGLLLPYLEPYDAKKALHQWGGLLLSRVLSAKNEYGVPYYIRTSPSRFVRITDATAEELRSDALSRESKVETQERIITIENHCAMLMEEGEAANFEEAFAKVSA